MIQLKREKRENCLEEMTLSTVDYLKDSVGELLAHAVAHTVEQQPSDPVEFLALYLLHESQIRNVVSKRRQEDSEKLYREREEDDKKREQAAIVIQQEIRQYLERKRLRLEEEERLRRELEEELEESKRRT